MLVSPLSSYTEALTPNMKVFGYRPFGKKLGLDEVTRVEPPQWDSNLNGRERDQSFLSAPNENTERRRCLHFRKRALTRH